MGAHRGVSTRRKTTAKLAGAAVTAGALLLAGPAGMAFADGGGGGAEDPGSGGDGSTWPPRDTVGDYAQQKPQGSLGIAPGQVFREVNPGADNRNDAASGGGP